MRPEDVDLSAGERIAFASSEGDGRDRWTELLVYHFANPPAPKRHWMSISRGCSRLPGETTKERRLLVGSLERALKLFDPAVDLGIIVSEQAREWLEEHNSVEIVVSSYPPVFRHPSVPELTKRSGSSDDEPWFGSAANADLVTRGLAERDEQVLSYLYGVPEEDLPSVNSMARDLGIGESSLRMALKNRTGIKVPLGAVAPVVDRERFRSRSARRNNRETADA